VSPSASFWTKGTTLHIFTRLVSATLTLALLLAATGAQAQDTAKRPYEINAILALTGSGAFIAHGQSEALRAVEKYINETGGIAGQPVHFTIADSGSSPQTDIQLTTALLASHPPFVIEGGPAPVCGGVATLYKAGPVMYCLSPGYYPERGGYVFGSGVDSHLGMGVVIRYLRERGITRLGVITVTDIAGQEADAALKALLADPVNKNIHAVTWEHFSPRDISVAAQMANIKAANPDVVIGWATGTPTGTLLQGYKEAGLTQPFVASQANENSRQMQQYKSMMPHELMMYSVMFPAEPLMRKGPLKTAIVDYTRAMKAVGAELNDSSSAETWDAALILVNALRALGTTATADRVRAYVAGLPSYDGPTGHFDFRIGNQRGLDATSSIMVRWDPQAISWKPISAPGGAPLK
jgi:branched-chain amino acid transport system substrate-binding protein